VTRGEKWLSRDTEHVTVIVLPTEQQRGAEKRVSHSPEEPSNQMIATGSQTHFDLSTENECKRS
jgi:hypothetical protein